MTQISFRYAQIAASINGNTNRKPQVDQMRSIMHPDEILLRRKAIATQRTSEMVLTFDDMFSRRVLRDTIYGHSQQFMYSAHCVQVHMANYIAAIMAN